MCRHRSLALLDLTSQRTHVSAENSASAILNVHLKQEGWEHGHNLRDNIHVLGGHRRVLPCTKKPLKKSRLDFKNHFDDAASLSPEKRKTAHPITNPRILKHTSHNDHDLTRRYIYQETKKQHHQNDV